MFKPKPLHHRRKSAPSSPQGEAGSSGNGRMLGTRILRTVIIVGVVLVVMVGLHTGVLYPRGQCLESVDMGEEPIEVVDSFYGDHTTKEVDLYARFSLFLYGWLANAWVGKCLSCQSVLMRWMQKQQLQL
jgi:hypothetical protein